jgi:hypothetical protein
LWLNTLTDERIAERIAAHVIDVPRSLPWSIGYERGAGRVDDRRRPDQPRAHSLTFAARSHAVAALGTLPAK